MKKILLSLFVGLIGLINFGYCSTVEDLIQVVQEDTNYTVPEAWTSLRALSSSQYGIYCIKPTIIGGGGVFNFGYSQTRNNINPGDYYTIYPNTSDKIICIYVNQPYIYVNNIGSNLSIINYELFRLDSLLAESLPVMSSLECQTEYNLIPISDVDQNYCVNNNLCPVEECSEGSGNWSALYINDIQHLGKPIINITFPDYLDWDYTTDEEEFNLDIVGYPVDTEYIDGIIRTQNYKPTSEDFTQLVGMLAPYSKYLLFLLFIFIIWAWIKKPFKSKKL